MFKPRSGAALLTLVLPLGIVAISFGSIFFRKAAPTHPLVAAGIRLVVAAILFAPIAWRRRANASRRLVGIAAVAGLFYAVHFGSWVWSLSLTTVAASVTLVTSTPLLLGVFAMATGRDRPGRRMWIAIGLACVGVAVISGSDWAFSAKALLGDGLALVGAAGMAGYLLLARGLGRDLDVWLFSTIATAVGGVVLMSTALASGIDPVPPSWTAMGYLALAAAIPQMIGHTSFTWALRHAKPTVVATATVGEPVGATILAWLWLGETVGGAVMLGCGLTLGSVILAIWAAGGQRSAQ